jgi:hypothetical protein
MKWLFHCVKTQSLFMICHYGGSDKYPALVYPIMLEFEPLLYKSPRSLVPFKYLRIHFTPVQWRLVGAVLCRASKFTANAISDLVQFARYMRTLMALRYGTWGPKISYPSSRGLNWSVSISIDRTTIGVLLGYGLSILNFSNTFRYRQIDAQKF